MFTDYTGRMERQVEKERREKDPILFGTFQNQSQIFTTNENINNILLKFIKFPKSWVRYNISKNNKFNIYSWKKIEKTIQF